MVAIWRDSRGEYGAPRIKMRLAAKGVTASRRRIRHVMAAEGLVSSYARPSFKPQPSKANDAPVANLIDRRFDGYAPRTHVVSDLTYVRVGGRWNYVCLLVDLYNREIVGHAAGERKTSDLVKSAFATLKFPLSDIEVLHTDRGGEFASTAIDEMLEVFGIERSLSRKGCPLRQRGHRIMQQDPEGDADLPQRLRQPRPAATEPQRLGVVVQQRAHPLDLGVYEPGRVQNGRFVPLEIVQLSVAIPVYGELASEGGGAGKSKGRMV